jgi:Squalene-hopene cyclase C-terminal domain
MNKHTKPSTIVTSKLSQFLTKAEAFLDERRVDWDLLGPDDVELETFNHVLRAWIQSGATARHLPILHRLAEAQHADGGWGDSRDDRRSKTRATAFVSQMLMRCDRQLASHAFREPARRGVEFLLRTQRPDGSWDDHKWHFLDATSVSIGTLLFAVSEPWTGETEADALKRGMAFVAAEQRDDGLWYHKSRGSPVEITAHFLQKIIPYGGSDRSVVAAMKALLARQHADGHWDHENVDSTCDATRALMLGITSPAGAATAASASSAVARSMTWLLAAARAGSVGARPGQRPSVLYTTDAIDTVWKYRQFIHGGNVILENYR